jgi:hypothetical protein
MRKTLTLVAVLCAAMFVSQSTARGAHNTVTLTAPQVTYIGRSIYRVTTNCTVRNTTANPQTGELTLLVFEVLFDGRVVQVIRQHLGQVDLPASGNAPAVPVQFDLHAIGSYVVLADYSSRIGANVVPHTHSGTYSFVIN